jgi:predicted kinase
MHTIYEKDEVEIGSKTGGLVPKKKRSAAKQYEYEKERRRNLSKKPGMSGDSPLIQALRKRAQSTGNYAEGKTYSQFLDESNRKAQLASKRGNQPKPGLKSGKEEVPKDIKMAGMPGSGKSTMAKKIAKATGGTATGYDDARETIHKGKGGRANQSEFPKVHSLTMNRLKNARKDKPRIQDNTNVNPKFKHSTDDSLKKDAGFRNITTVSPRTSQRRSFARNAKREHPVPRFVMKSMASQEKQFRKSKEGKQAVQTGKKLTKQLRLNRKSASARLGVQNSRQRAESFTYLSYFEFLDEAFKRTGHVAMDADYANKG